MVNVAFSVKIPDKELSTWYVSPAEVQIPPDAKKVRLPTGVELAVFNNIAVPIRRANFLALAIGLGYDEVYKHHFLDKIYIGVADEDDPSPTGGFGARIYYGDDEREASVKYPVRAVKFIAKLLGPLPCQAYALYLFVRWEEGKPVLGPLMFHGEKGYAIVWPLGVDVLKALGAVLTRNTICVIDADEELEKVIDEAVERWARELGVIE